MPGEIEQATYIDETGRRRSRRFSVKSVEDILGEVKIPEKDRKKILTAFEAKMESELTAHTQALQTKYDDLQNELKHEKDEKDQIETEKADILNELSREKDIKKELEGEVASLEKVKEELMTQIQDTTPTKPEPRSTVLIIKDKMIEQLDQVSFSDTVDWKISEDIGLISELEDTLKLDSSVENLIKYEKVVLILGLTEVVTTRGGRDMSDLVSRYVTNIKSLASRMEVAVVEIPAIKPDGNYSGPLLFNMELRKSLNIENVQLIETENKVKQENKNQKMWKDAMTLNETGIRLFAYIITDSITIPEPKVMDMDVDNDDNDDQVYVEIPYGFTGKLLRDGGKHIRRLCSNHKARISLGKWSERRSTNSKEAALIRGPLRDRKIAKQALDIESKKFLQEKKSTGK